MIIYTYDKGHYLTLKQSLEQQTGMRSVYLNLTNCCTCSCTFCLRNLKKMDEDKSLWLKQEPTIEEVKQVLDKAPWDVINEIVFCGFGEPTMRLADVVELLRYIKKNHPDVKTRINTNGLSDLEFGRDTSKDFAGNILDTLSISLNASNAERYLELTRSSFGIGSQAALLKFAADCQRYVPHVVLTVVDQVENPAEIAACQKLCGERGLTLRVRPYEAE